MTRFPNIIAFFLSLCATVAVARAELPLSAKNRVNPGEEITPHLRYEGNAQRVQIAGTWNKWADRSDLALSNGLWVLDMRTLPLPPGRHEFKVIVDGEWESGENRVLFLNEKREIERPPSVALRTVLQRPDEILVYLRSAVERPDQIKVRIDPNVPVRDVQVLPASEDALVRGYALCGDYICFLFDERRYEVDIAPWDKVAATGNFTGWVGEGGDRGQWLLHDDDDDGVWEMWVEKWGLRLLPGETEPVFKFVVNGRQWLSPRQSGNALPDGKGNINLVVQTNTTGCTVIRILTDKPIDMTKTHTLQMDGVAARTLREDIAPGPALDAITSDKVLGVTLDKERGTTTYRLFSPRASAVNLCLYLTPEYVRYQPEHQVLEPSEQYPMWKDVADGVWEITLLGLDIGKYYSFRVEGPDGAGEGFRPMDQAGDPYAVAAAHGHNNAIVIDREATNAWFTGWADEAWQTPKPEDMIIYETHIRNFTIHPSSLVPAAMRGTYPGFSATVGTGAGLDHLKKLGVNMIELMPVNEFENRVRDYGWGYNTVFFFAPEASYARAPLKGSQYYEFKQLVNDLHRHGFGVILDVVYNHVGGPNIHALIDRKYHFRLTPEYQNINFSGCGNDFRTEAPMVSKFIVRNVEYWMKEFHVDGFRFDLGELVDMGTMLAVRDAAKAINPNVILISEPWSFRGQNKPELRGTGWSAWNNDFRHATKDFARGHVDREWLRMCMSGSWEIWTDNPLQSINYLESHDDMALADEFCLRPDKNGIHLQPYDVAMNKVSATLLLTSLGIPMLAEGQEFLRSKFGVHNSFDKGDAVNALRWVDRDRPLANEAFDYYRALVALRQSDAGRAFRVTQKPPPDYLQWIAPPENRAAGFILNAPRRHAGNGFVVLLNTADYPATFSFQLPEGKWRIIGDGQRIDPAGLKSYEKLTGPRTMNVKVPEMRSLVIMDGF